MLFGSSGIRQFDRELVETALSVGSSLADAVHGYYCGYGYPYNESIAFPHLIIPGS